MKTELMDGIEEGIKKHLESSGIDISEDLEFLGHKHKVNISNEDIFHQLAQHFEIKSLHNSGGLYFYLRCEGNPWTISLRDENLKEFLALFLLDKTVHNIYHQPGYQKYFDSKMTHYSTNF